MCLNLKVYTEWREIAEVLRNRVFKENEQHVIDIFDIKVCPSTNDYNYIF